MTTITLSALLTECGLSKQKDQSLPAGSKPFTMFQHLYQYTTYVEAESIYSTPEAPIKTYLPLQFIREESGILVPSEGSTIVIWCKLLNDDRVVQCTKGFFMKMVQRGIVYTNMNTVRVEKVSW
jgi:hypothetical protein